MNVFLDKQYSNFTVTKFKLNSKIKYCIWYLDANDDEHFYKTGDKITAFASLEDTGHFLEDYKISYDTITFDIDEIISSLADMTFDCTKVIDFLNIVSDVARECNIKIHEEKEFHLIYNKLFYGMNLSTINESNRRYHPVFNKAEMRILKGYIKICIQIIENNIIE